MTYLFTLSSQIQIQPKLTLFTGLDIRHVPVSALVSDRNSRYHC